MFKNTGLYLVVAVVLSSVSLFAQENKPTPTDRHKIVVETDSGRYGVGAEKLDPKELGVAIYPGAKIDESGNNESYASLSFEWGQDSTRLYVQKYITSDSPEKVVSFYRKQLSKYGPVLECRAGEPINAVPAKTSCDSDDDPKSIELKVGTEGRQHIVGVTPTAHGTEFGLVYLDRTVRSKR